MVLATSRGTEQRTDGLWVHHGKLSVGPIGTAGGAPGDINANRGDGTGAYFFGGVGGQYLYYNGTAFLLVGGPLTINTPGSIRTSDLAAGAVHNLWSLQLAPSGSTTATSQVPMPGGFGTGLTLTGYTGGPLVIQGVIQLFHNTANTTNTIHLYVNAADQNIRFSAQSPAVATNNFIVPILATLVLAAGAPIIQLYWNTSSGTLSSQTGLYQWLVVQENKR